MRREINTLEDLAYMAKECKGVVRLSVYEDGSVSLLTPIHTYNSTFLVSRDILIFEDGKVPDPPKREILFEFK